MVSCVLARLQGQVTERQAADAITPRVWGVIRLLYHAEFSDLPPADVLLRLISRSGRLVHGVLEQQTGACRASGIHSVALSSALRCEAARN